MLLTDLLSALTLLTRLPVAGFLPAAGPANPARCLWAFPVVGVVVNGTGGLLYWLARMSGLPALLAAAWTLAAMLMLTGALHEDGLADTADGFGGGITPARKLEIMRDSRIGTYGAAALLLSLLVRAAALSELSHPPLVLNALILAGMVGRSGMILPLLLLPPARAEGMGASVGRPGTIGAAVGLAVAIIPPYLLLPPLPATALLSIGFGLSLLVARVAYRQVGGYTGDILGAAEVATECAVLTVIAGMFA